MNNIPESSYHVGENCFSSINQLHKRYLKDSGWIDSKNSNRSLRNGECIPWTTYSFLYWLEKRNLGESYLLEFGSGASTLFWAKNFRDVVSIETDSNWYWRIKTSTSNFPNTHVKLLTDICDTSSVSYDNSIFNSVSEDISNFPELNNTYLNFEYTNLKEYINKADYIFIDGGPRNTYAYLSSIYAKKDAIIIVDNTDSYYLKMGIASLNKAGYKEIVFHSLGPLNHYSWSTSIFIKDFSML